MTTLLIRPNRNEPDRAALEAKGLPVVVDPFLTIEQVPNPEGARRLVDALATGEPCWLVVTSHNAWENWLAQCIPGELENIIVNHPALRCGAIGETTATVLTDLGVAEVTIPGRNDGESLAGLIAHSAPCPVVLPSGSISMRNIPDTLVPQGFQVLEEVFYATDQVVAVPTSVAAIESGEVTSVVFRSPSAVRAFFHFVPTPPATLALVCGGRTTAREVARMGAEATVISATPTPESVAEAVWMIQKGRDR
jgi:uroporphyrinogen-III synthase